MAEEYVKLISANEPVETFNLKITNYSNTQERDLKTDVVNEVEIAGFDLTLVNAVVTLDGVITSSVTADDYPNSGLYNDHKHGMGIEIEKITQRDEWNYFSTGGLSKIRWNRGGFIWTRTGTVISRDVDFDANKNALDYTIRFAILDISAENRNIEP
jgi:hypothetical protein